MSADLRHALRQLAQTPGFALVVAVVIALGIGINVVTFGAVDALFFRPPAGVREPAAVRRVEIEMPKTPGQQVFFNTGYSLADVDALRARRETFLGLASYASGMAALTDGGARAAAGVTADGEPRKIHVTVSGDGFFETLGVRPALGRTFTAAEDTTFDEAPVVVLADRFWRRAFGGDPAVLGRAIRLNGRPFTVIGVAPARFVGVELEPADVFVPLGMASAIGFQRNFIRKPSMKWLHAVARLAPGVDDRRADAVATTVLRGVDAASPGPVLGFDAKRGRVVRVAPLNAYFGANAFATASPVPLWMLGATGAVLLVVCANVANLLVARAERRRREIATRLALGAGSGRIVRQLLAEGVVLAVLGGALGVALASVAARLVVLVPGMPDLEHVVDARAMLFALVATMVTTVGFALVPALHAARADAGELLRAGARGSARATPIRTALLATQFAASLALLGVGALFVRSLRNVQAIDVGFPIDRALTASVDWDAFGIPAKEARALVTRVAEQARAMPAVAGASVVSLAPFDGVSMASLRVPGRGDLSALSGAPGGLFFTNSVDTAYFHTLGIPLVRGRAFDARDVPPAPSPVIVSETFAQRVWPGEEALGKCVSNDDDPKAACTGRVIGVARDARFMSLTSSVAPIYYSPLAHQIDGPTQLVVQLRPGVSDAARRRTMAALRTAFATLDPRVGFASVRPLGQATIQGAVAPYRVSAAAFTVFGALALGLAAIGLYGAIAFAVAQRTSEFGVRVALGARGRDIAALVVGQGVRLIAAGATIGVLAAVVVARLLRSRLYGVDPLDVPALAAVAGVLAAVALVACWLPARRAARVEPSVALRNDG